VTEDSVIIDLGRIRFPPEVAARLKSKKGSGTTEHNTYGRLVRLYVRMGLCLDTHGIHTLEQLDGLLKRVSESELSALEARIIEKVVARLAPVSPPPKPSKPSKPSKRK
jgi:hypothetical protein